MSQRDNDESSKHDGGSKSENKSGHQGDKTKNAAKNRKIDPKEKGR